MYLENMIFYTFDGFFSIACNHFIHIVFIVFYCSSITHNLLLFSIKHKIFLQMGFDIINGMMSFV